jgi:KaiC/GvpD/RAD55 family RecA-like ATPase
MLKKDLILQSPLRLLIPEAEDIIPAGGFGAVLARAGVGKTSFLIQIALSTLLVEKNVLHISLDDPIKKVSLRYEEVLKRLSKQYHMSQVNEIWEAILPHRFIMTFNVEGFSVPKLKERMTDLIEQNIFAPQMIIIDGLPFDADARKSLTELKTFIKDCSVNIWLTVRTHRHEKADPQGIPASLVPVIDLFDAVIQLRPKGDEIHVRVLKQGESPSDHPALLLDPNTMLIKNK